MSAQNDDVGPEHYYDNKRQLEWAPALANGSAVLALAGIVANANDQDAALTGLTLALSIFGLGLCTALISLRASLKSFGHQLSIAAAARDVHEQINPLIARFNATAGDENINIQQILIRILPLTGNIATEHQRLLKLYKLYSAINDAFNAISILACILGFIVLLAGHALGWFTPRHLRRQWPRWQGETNTPAFPKGTLGSFGLFVVQRSNRAPSLVLR